MELLLEKIFFTEVDNPVVLVREMLPLIGHESKLVLLKAIIYIRSPRLGLGNKRLGLEMISCLIENDPSFFVEYLPMYVFYCSWRDLNEFLGTSIAPEIISFWGRQLQHDAASESISLAAKWIPSEKSPEDNEYHCFGKLASSMGITKAQLRKTYLSPLRKRLSIVEHHVTQKEFTKIDYFKLSKRARSKYHHLFLREDSDRYLKYLENVNWFWLPSSYWDPSQIPEVENTVFCFNEKATSKIFFVVDTSAMMRPIPLKIAFKLIEQVYAKHGAEHALYLVGYSNQTCIKPISGKLNQLIEDLTNEVNIRDLVSKLRKENPKDVILVLTSNYAVINIDNENTADLWWSISHTPLQIIDRSERMERPLHIVSGYDRDFLETLAETLSIKRSKFMNLKLRKISTLPNFRAKS